MYEHGTGYAASNSKLRHAETFENRVLGSPAKSAKKPGVLEIIMAPGTCTFWG